MSTPTNFNQRDPVPRPSGGTPRSPALPITTSYYLAETLLPLDEVGYRAAGVLPYYDEENTRYILLGSEIRDGVEQICFLAGKRDLTDRDPEHTAARELWEETGRLLALPELYYALRTGGQRQVLWLHNAKLALHLLNVGSDERFRTLPARYAEMTTRPPDSDMSRLHWASTERVRAALTEAKLECDGAVLPVWPVVRGALRNRLLGDFMHWPAERPAATPPPSPAPELRTPPGSPRPTISHPHTIVPPAPLPPPQPAIPASTKAKPKPVQPKSEAKGPRPPQKEAPELKPAAEVTWPELLRNAEHYLKA